MRFALFLLVILTPTYAQPTPATTHINVSATGTAYGEPDIATVHLGVSLRNSELTTALTSANATADALLVTLNEQGVALEDIRTLSFNVYQEEIFNPNTGQGEPADFRVTNLFAVTIRDVTSLGEILGAALNTGANTVQNVQYSVADSAALEAVARERAMEAALAKAEQLAGLANVSLAEVVGISEVDTPTQPEPRFMAAESTQGVPTASGQLAVRVDVTVTIAIE